MPPSPALDLALPSGHRRRVQSTVLQDAALSLAVLVPDLFFFSEIAYPETGWPTRLQVVACSLPEAVALVFRRRRPAAVFAVVWAVATGAVLLTLGDVLVFTPYFGMLIALYAVAEQRRLPGALAALALACVPAALAIYLLVAREAAPGHEVSALLGSLLFYLPLTAAAWSLARWGRASRAAAEQDRRELAAAREAVARERGQIARELHDIVAQAVAVMVMRAEGARGAVATDPGRAAEALGHIEDLGRAAMADLRRMLRLLRAVDTPVADFGRRGLADLEPLLADVRRAGVLVDLEVHGTPAHVHDGVDLTAFRLVQEAVTNITKHAGPGTHAIVRITWSDTLAIEVVDDGLGQAPAASKDLSTGHGLLGLAERIAVFGGELTAAPHESGFRVAATLPVSADPAV